MSRLRSEAAPDMPRATCEPDTQRATEPLPLFRPEALRKQERFFGEVLLIRSFSLGFLSWLVTGAAAFASSVLFFGSYTETTSVRGVLLQGPAPASRASVAISYPGAAIKPGMHFAIRCVRCPDPAMQLPVVARSVSSVAAENAKASSSRARQVVEFSYEAQAASLLRQMALSGTAVELAVPGGRRRLWELFEPASGREKS